jgi:hypothetical protein
MKLSHAVLSFALSSAVGCETEDPSDVVVDNDYAVSDAGDAAAGTTVVEAWWAVTLLPEAVAPGAEGQAERTVPNEDFAYAVLAPGWDPSSATPPVKLLAVRSADKLAVGRGETLHVHVSPDTFVGDCTTGRVLSQDEADFITQRIFPGVFAGRSYDARTCTAAPGPGGDGGAEN